MRFEKEKVFVFPAALVEVVEAPRGLTRRVSDADDARIEVMSDRRKMRVKFCWVRARAVVSFWFSLRGRRACQLCVRA